MVKINKKSKLPDGKKKPTALTNLLPVLTAAGVESVCIDYCGSGDSGAIDSVYFSPEKENSSKKSELMNQIENAVYEFLEDADDWCNNDGGQGRIDLEVKTGKMIWHHETNYTQTHDFDAAIKLK